MSGETSNEETAVESVASNEAAETAEEQVTLESLSEQVNKVISINKELIASRDAAKTKLREAEEASQLQAKTEQRQGVEGELDALEQKLGKRLNDVLVSNALEKELLSAGARNVEMTKKLLDKQNIKVVNGKADSEMITQSINSLKETASYLFSDKEDETSQESKPAAMSVARAGEPENVDIVNKEIAEATTTADLKAVLKKHGMTN